MKAILKHFFLISFLFLSSQNTRAQENIREFLVLGVELAEEFTAAYADPAAEGLMYGMTGGWYNSGQVRKPWAVEISIVTNGAFVPSDARSFTIDTSEFEDLTTISGEAVVEIPTILGGSRTPVMFVADVEGEFYQFESPEGFGLADLNLLPNAFLQAKVGLPKATEVGIRVFPKIAVEDVEVGLFGFAAQHEFSRWIGALDTSPLAFSAMVAYTRLFADYDFETGGDVLGENQQIDVRMNSWLFEIIASTKFPKLNVYGGLGYVNGDSDTSLKGTYEIQTSTPLTFTDPFDFQNSVDGIRANIGINWRAGWFGLNTAYTFQGYNNFSFAINFNVR